jgi:acetyltransferase
VRPEDVALYSDFLRGVCAEDLRLRFFARIAELSAAEADKLSHLDYGHEMAFIAIAAVHICFRRICTAVNRVVVEDGQ